MFTCRAAGSISFLWIPFFRDWYGAATITSFLASPLLGAIPVSAKMKQYQYLLFFFADCSWFVLHPAIASISSTSKFLWVFLRKCFAVAVNASCNAHHNTNLVKLFTSFSAILFYRHLFMFINQWTNFWWRKNVNILIHFSASTSRWHLTKTGRTW